MNPDPKHPKTDLDAPFSAINPRHTPRVMETLRQAGVNFDVTVNGKDDGSVSEGYDIFWFRPEADQDQISNIIRLTLSNGHKP